MTTAAGALARPLCLLVALQIRHELPIHAIEGGARTEEHARGRRTRLVPNFLSSQLPSPRRDEDRDRELKPDSGEPRDGASLAPLRSEGSAGGEAAGRFCRDWSARSVSDEGASGSPLIPRGNLGLCEIFRKLAKRRVSSDAHNA